MNDDNNKNTEAAGRGSRRGALVVGGLIIVSLLLYVVGDRVTPYSSQARIQAFVVPVAAEVSGRVLKVYVDDNKEVRAGDPLFEIDREQYQIALQRAQADLESIGHSVGASVASVEAARAALQAAIAGREMAESDAARQERLYREDPGAISVRRLEIAQAGRKEARSHVQRAEADLMKAQEAAGAEGDDNAQLRSARSALEKAQLDLTRTRVVAPAGGLVTDLRTDVGHFAAAGAPVLTLIAIRDLWIDADMTENNLGNIDVGDEVAIALDVLPGRIFKGRVRSIGRGVASGQASSPGTLPTIDNSRDWLRQAQRFPVTVEFDAEEKSALSRMRVGGQAAVLVYSGDNPLLNLLGALYIRVMSLLSYLY